MLKFSTTTTIEIKIAVSCDPALDMTSAEINAYLQGDFDSLKIKQDQAIVIIRNGAANVPLVADQEINLSATLIELSNISFTSNFIILMCTPR